MVVTILKIIAFLFMTAIAVGIVFFLIAAWVINTKQPEYIDGTDEVKDIFW